MTHVRWLCVGLIGFCAVGCADTNDRRFQRIAVPGVDRTFAQAINAAGQVVGTCADRDNHVRGFVFEADVYTVIDFPGSISTDVTAIDSAGRIFGFYNDRNGFVLDAGTFSDLGRGLVTGVNDSGDIVGIDGQRGYLVRNGVKTSIAYPGRDVTGATHINAQGDIVGYAFNSGPHGSIDDGVQFVLRGDTWELPVLPAGATLRGINDLGMMAGTFRSNDGGHHGFLYRDGTYELIDGPPRETHSTYAYGIGPSGEVLGSYSQSYDAPNGEVGYVYRHGP